MAILIEVDVNVDVNVGVVISVRVNSGYLCGDIVAIDFGVCESVMVEVKGGNL